MTAKNRQVTFYADPEVFDWIQDLRKENPGNKLSAELNRALRDYIGITKMPAGLESAIDQMRDSVGSTASLKEQMDDLQKTQQVMMESLCSISKKMADLKQPTDAIAESYLKRNDEITKQLVAGSFPWNNSDKNTSLSSYAARHRDNEGKK